MTGNGIREIARIAGVSVSTVSRALNRTGRISERRTAEIFRIAAELGYAPRGRGRIIAVILPESAVELKWYSINLLNALRRDAARRGYSLEIVSSDQLHILGERAVQGMLSFDFNNQLAERIGRTNAAPLVCINDSARHIDQVYSVFSDERQAMKLAVGCLAGFGHRRIGLVLNGDPGSYCNRTRREAFERELARRNLENSDEFVVNQSEVEWRLHGVIQRLLAAEVTAIINTGESRAASALSSLHACRVSVPEQISLICWEMSEVSEFLTPPLTTLGQDFGELARTALDTLENRIDGRPVYKDTFVPYLLRERGSVAVPRKTR